jgi:putative ABC transport system permease protein
MRRLAQALAVTQVSLRSLPQRKGSSLVIGLSMACVTAVLLSMLSKTEGLVRAYDSGAGPSRVIVLSETTPSGYGRSISQGEVGTILDAPGIARLPGGGPAADPELLFWIPPTGAYAIGSPELRGIGRAGLALRPRFKVLTGRLFYPGRHELMVGVRAARAFGLKVGDRLILPDGEWSIVGVFSDGGGILEGELLGDADTIMSASGISRFGSVLVRLDRPSALGRFKRWLTHNPTLSVTAESEADFAAQTANRLGAYFTRVAYVIATIMTLGALFGTVKIMTASVATRAREIAILRAMGFGSLPVGTAIVFETAILSISGAALGGGLAWLLSDGEMIRRFDGAYAASVTPGLFMLGLAWALAVALIGGLPPAIRAARLSASRALLTG